MRPAEPTAAPAQAVSGSGLNGVPTTESWQRNLHRGPSLFDQALQSFKTAGATAYGASLLLHLSFLLCLGLWILPQLKESTSVTTVISSEEEAPGPFDSLGDVQLDLPSGESSEVAPQFVSDVAPDAELSVLEHKFLEHVLAAGSEGDGDSHGLSGAGGAGGGGGFRLLEPRNAVRAGSFTAWTIPIPRFVGEQVKAGDSPHPGQDYHIVIQVKVPGTRRAYSISDLSGKVIGTDGYIQIIPAQAFVQDDDGQLVRASLGRNLPVVDGVVQIVIRVPGAEDLVKDTIRVKSKILKENKILELVFEEARSKE